MPRSQQTSCPIPGLKLLGIMLRNRCWSHHHFSHPIPCMKLLKIMLRNRCWSHHHFSHPIPGTKLLEIMLRNRCWSHHHFSHLIPSMKFAEDYVCWEIDVGPITTFHTRLFHVWNWLKIMLRNSVGPITTFHTRNIAAGTNRRWWRMLPERLVWSAPDEAAMRMATFFHRFPAPQSPPPHSSQIIHAGSWRRDTDLQLLAHSIIWSHHSLVDFIISVS